MTKMYRILCTINNSTYFYIIDTIEKSFLEEYFNFSTLRHLTMSSFLFFKIKDSLVKPT